MVNTVISRNRLEKKQKFTLPNNIGCTASHGTDQIPDGMEVFINPELDWINYSDSTTGDVVKLFDGKHVVAPPPFGRAFGDPNRTPGEAIRDSDFGGNPVFKEGVQSDNQFQMIISDCRNSIKRYQETIAETMEKIAKTSDRQDLPAIFFDLHDTDNRLLTPNGWRPRQIVFNPQNGDTSDQTNRTQNIPSAYDEFDGFPLAIVSTLDGATADREITNRLTRELDRRLSSFANQIHFEDEVERLHLSEELTGSVLVDNLFHGGYIIEMAEKVRENHPNFNAFQIEINRGLYVDPETEEKIPEQVAQISRIIYRSVMSACYNNQ